MADGRSARLWHRGWPLGLLCVLASMVWLVTDHYPQVTFTLASDAIACVLVAVASCGVGLVLRSSRAVLSGLLMSAVGGVLVLAGPAVGGFVHASLLDAGSLAIALSLTPVVVVVAESVMGSAELSGEGLWPGLAAAVGLLLVLPAPSVSDVRNDVALVMAPVLTGIGCVLFRRSGIGVAAVWRASAGFVGGALVFGLGALVASASQRALPVVSVAAVVIDAVLFGLALVALSRLSASQYVARYVLAPLVILAEGPVLLRSMVTWRSVGCAVLLGVAAVVLLRSSEPEEVPGESLEDHRLRG